MNFGHEEEFPDEEEEAEDEGLCEWEGFQQKNLVDAMKQYRGSLINHSW